MTNSDRVPIYQLDFSDKFIENFQSKSESIFNSDALSEGNYVRKFEREFCEFIGCKSAVATTSCTTALEISLRSIGVEGRDVILPTNTFVATAMAAKAAGGDVCLVDIEPETFAIDPDNLREKINRETGAVILVHIGGIISEYIEEIVEICDNYGVPLIEDAAHAHGATRKGHTAGMIGKIGCFSFFPTKVMTTGEGGMMTVQDEDLAVELESLKNFGIEMDDRRTSQSMFVREGINGRITEFQGLLGTLELERVGERIARRNELAAIYRDKLSDSEFKIATVEEGVNPHYKLIVETEYDVDEINEYCEENNVSLTGEVYQTPVHKQPIFETSYQNSDFPVANQFAEKHFCPPLYPELTESDVDYVCEVLIDAISN